MLPLQGQLLIAKDPTDELGFHRRVVLILQHGQGNSISLGLIINQPSKTIVTSLAGGLFDNDFVWDKPILLGGTVKSSLRVLHTDPDHADQTLGPGMHVTTDALKAQHILSQRIEPSLVIANQTTWDARELERQVTQDWWYLLPATPRYLFWDGRRNLWKTLRQAAEYRALTHNLGVRNFPPLANVN